MPGVKVYTSNRLEHLLDALADVVAASPLPVLIPECIVVQSKGMERWVATGLAERFGVWANCAYPFPNGVLDTILSALGARVQPNGFDRTDATWRIMRILSALSPQPEFASLHRYLQDDDRGVKRLQLSRRLADLFDQYTVYRPDMILAWEKGAVGSAHSSTEAVLWQARLWTELIAESNLVHRARLRELLLRTSLPQDVNLQGLPPRICVFGISYLPPFHLQALHAARAFVDVNIFSINPCKHLWEYIRPEREILAALRRAPGAAASAEAMHLEEGNSLLASWGRLGRGFFALVHDVLGEGQWQEVECGYPQPDLSTLLGCIQRDILELNEPRRQTGPLPIVDNDRSVQVHSCHSPMREVEVLYDNLLEFLEQLPELSPRDIVVMTPDIDTYAPLIHAVFENPHDESVRIPFALADRNQLEECPLIKAFLDMLELPVRRFEASAILGFLEVPAMRTAAGLNEGDVEALRRWVQETGIRWGFDADDRATAGLLAFGENSWTSGLDRMILGYAMAGTDSCAGIAPYDEIEGADAAVAGKLAAFVTRLATLRDTLAGSMTLSSWASTLRDIVKDLFVEEEETAAQRGTLLSAIGRLESLGTSTGFTESLAVDPVADHLRAEISQHTSLGGFMTRGVTFCELLPMRAIPFKVVCLLGMNHADFPRTAHAPSFDLMRQNPLPGDRSRRNDDLYLFLEALLSARCALYISYVGQSLRDNASMPPSVLVSQLLDYVNVNYHCAQEPDVEPQAPSSRLVVRHRLHPFSPVYFQCLSGKHSGDERMFSYSPEHLTAALSWLGPKSIPPFFREPLPAFEPEDNRIQLDDMCAFFGSPSRHLLKKRLGIILGDRDGMLDDVEPFELAGLDKFLAGEFAVHQALAGREDSALVEELRMRGTAPPAAVGACVVENLVSAARNVATAVRAASGGADAGLCEVSVVLDHLTIVGQVSGVTPCGLVNFRFGQLRAADQIRTWIQLLAAASADRLAVRRATLIGRDAGADVFDCPDKPDLILRALVGLYIAGMSAPLRFFPMTSWEFANRTLVKKQSEDEGMSAARATWQGNDHSPGESQDAYYSLCFRGVEPLNEEFRDRAREVFGPMLERGR